MLVGLYMLRSAMLLSKSTLGNLVGLVCYVKVNQTNHLH